MIKALQKTWLERSSRNGGLLQGKGLRWISMMWPGRSAGTALTEVTTPDDAQRWWSTTVTR